MHSCNIPQTNSNLLVGQLQLVFKQFTLNEKSCSTSTQKTGKVKIIQTFFFQLNLQHEIQYLCPIDCTLLAVKINSDTTRYQKIHPNKSLRAIQAARDSEQMVQIKRITTS